MNSETAAYSTEAHQLALSTGASAPDLENLCNREALLSILTDANIEQDICEDVCDTCELSNLNALTIASGLLSVEQVAKFCFLTKDEAEVCLEFVHFPLRCSCKPAYLTRCALFPEFPQWTLFTSIHVPSYNERPMFSV